MTGRYASHIGMQDGVIEPPTRSGLPLDQRLMPAYFKDLGYTTHAIGKWHLGKTFDFIGSRYKKGRYDL